MRVGWHPFRGPIGARQRRLCQQHQWPTSRPAAVQDTRLMGPPLVSGELMSKACSAGEARASAPSPWAPPTPLAAEGAPGSSPPPCSVAMTVTTLRSDLVHTKCFTTLATTERAWSS